MARIVLLVQPTPTGLSLTWSDGPAAFAAYDVSAKGLATAAEAARKALGAVVECYFSEDAADATASMTAMATAGYGLYQAFFKTPAEQQARATEARKWLDTLQADDGAQTLEIVAEGAPPVPWNLVYDRRPDSAAFKTGGDDPTRWRPFWGLRYDLSGGRRVSPLRRLPILQNPRVVVVTDPLVLDRLPTESREISALCQEHGWSHARSRAELAEVLQGRRPDLLYWLGHTQTDPFGLVLGDDVMTPEDLKALLEGDPFENSAEVFGGVAFLNACGTTGGDPSGSFLDVLHPLGLSGFIATEQVTVDTFAAPLGREFLSAFVVRGEPLGQVMRHLRGQVPLGLLYGCYCPPVIHVRNSASTPSVDAGSIVLTRAGAGTKLGRSPGTTTSESYPLPPQPYRSLQSYGAEDRALFAGREADTLRFAQLLDEPGTRLVILHGESGVGKTSFLKAGVIPYLENECVGYRFTRDRSTQDGDTVLLIRATNDPVAQIATALTAYCARALTYKAPLGDPVTADLPGCLSEAVGGRTDRDALRDALRADLGLLGRLLASLSRKLPFTPVLVIDQAEEVFTLARNPEDEENRAHALEMLRRAATGPAGFKIVVSLRTEYHGRFTDRLRKGAHDGGGVRDYLLTDFDLDALIEVIRRPTCSTAIEYATDIPAKKYGFIYSEGVAEEIARRVRAYTINRQDSVLPLLQVICTQLYDRVSTRPERAVTLADLEAIGGVEGGMRAHAEGLVRRLFSRPIDQKAFKRLLAGSETQLFIRQSDGTLTTALLPAEFLAEHWTGRMPFDEVLRNAGDGDWRLLRVNSLRIGSDDQERAYVSLGHDALARVAARWQDEHKRWAQFRKYAAAMIGLALLVGVLSVLTGWALKAETEAREQKGKAETAKLKAISEAQSAEVARDNAIQSRDIAEKARGESKKRFKLAAEAFEVIVFKIQALLEERSGVQKLREELLAEARKGLNDLLLKTGPELAGDHQEIDDSDRKAAHLLRLRIYLKLGDVDKSLGNTAQALDDYLEAIKIAKSLPQDDPKVEKEIATVYHKLSETALSAGQTKKAAAHARESRLLRKNSLDRDPANRVSRSDYAAALDRLAAVEMECGRMGEAMRACNESLVARQELLETSARPNSGVVAQGHDQAAALSRRLMEVAETLKGLKDTRQAARDLAQSHERAAAIALRKWDTESALKSAAAALDLRKRLSDQCPDRMEDQLKVADAYTLQGTIDYNRSNLEECQKSYQYANNILKNIVDNDTLNAVARAEYALAQARLGLVPLRLGHSEEAEKQTATAREYCVKVAKDDPGSARLKGYLASCCEYYGNVLLQLRRYDDAIAQYEVALGLWMELAKMDDVNVRYRINLAHAWERIGNAMMQQALIEDFSKTARDTLDAKRTVGLMTRGNRQVTASFDQALRADLLAVPIACLLRSSDQRLTLIEQDKGNAFLKRQAALSYERLTTAYLNAGSYPKARDSAKRAWEGFQALLAEDPSNLTAMWDLGLALQRLGDVNFREGKALAAFEKWQESLSIYQSGLLHDPSNVEFLEGIASAYERFADAYWETHRLELSLEADKAALEHRRTIHKQIPTGEAAIHSLMIAERRLGYRHWGYLRQADTAVKYSQTILEHYESALKAAGPRRRSDLIEDEREKILLSINVFIQFQLFKKSITSEIYAATLAAKGSRLLKEYGITDDWIYQAARGYIQTAAKESLNPDTRKQFREKSLRLLQKIQSVNIPKIGDLQDSCWAPLRSRPEFESLRAQPPAAGP